MSNFDLGLFSTQIALVFAICQLKLERTHRREWTMRQMDQTADVPVEIPALNLMELGLAVGIRGNYDGSLRCLKYGAHRHRQRMGDMVVILIILRSSFTCSILKEFDGQPKMVILLTVVIILILMPLLVRSCENKKD